MEEEKRIKAQWGPVWKRTAGATAVGMVVGAAVARRRLRLALEAGPAQEIAASTLLAAAASKPPSTIIFTSALAGGLTAGTTTGLFLVSRELLRVDMQWEGMVPSLYAGMATGALLGAATGGPYPALLGMSTLGGLAAVGEGGVALWNRWYNKKRQQIFQQRLIEKRQTLLRQRAQAAQSELEHIDQQLETIAYHLNAQKEKEEAAHESVMSWMSLKVPSWFPIQPVTEETQKKKQEAEALEKELMDRYYAQRELEYQQQLQRQRDTKEVSNAQ
ncbi:uncharacterized protein ACA1_078490 [Acanthamoeba castellanii str. Neff]|uniref:Transmembrane protein n=1 Tax=Acanthamoeba castellanii (strain ATCC 30010 / Neff) TaxID=1257118 RepID=L8GT48_ACACF|nr:uncharacterized protein ACA1_078490 [Acanthamoeba castellanii str. Neff]ELR15788.1 hypothetical protein ACA1_078490 [Acanthamoeba castellanii str. Neff]